jgi:hypothetical protein
LFRSRDDVECRLRGLREFGEPISPSAFLALFLAPLGPALRASAEGTLEGLRLSRALRERVVSIWQLWEELRRCAGEPAAIPRSQRVRWVREEYATDTLRAALACGQAVALCRELQGFARELSEEQRWPAAWIRSADLEELGLPRGPRWRVALEAALDAQLDGRFRDRAGALAWLGAWMRAEPPARS